MKSPIIYYGGKTTMLQHILPIIPAHEVYTEVFCGGAAVLFAKPKAKNETINDKLDIVINFYEQLKSNYAKLKKLIDASCFSRTLHTKALFILKNKGFFDKVQLAWAFWMCSNFSFGNKIGGGFKYSNDQSIVPPKVMKNMKEQFTAMIVERIEHIHIENNDAITVLKSRNVPKAFHYLDPPYPGTDQGHYKGYTYDDLEELFIECERIKGKFLLSNYNSELLEKYTQKNSWYKKEFSYKKNNMRKNGISKVEVIISNYIPAGNMELEF